VQFLGTGPNFVFEVSDLTGKDALSERAPILVMRITSAKDANIGKGVSQLAIVHDAITGWANDGAELPV
jgi:hypothetical protein